MNKTEDRQEQRKKEIAGFTALLKSGFTELAAAEYKSAEDFERQASTEEYNELVGRAFAQAALAIYHSLGYVTPFEIIRYTDHYFFAKKLPARYDNSGVIANVAYANRFSFNVRLRGGKNSPFSDKSVVAKFYFQLSQKRRDALLGRISADSSLLERCRNGFLDLRIFDLCAELDIKVLPTRYEDFSKVVFWKNLQRKDNENWQDETAARAITPAVLLLMTDMMTVNLDFFLDKRGLSLWETIKEQLDKTDYSYLDTISEMIERPLSKGISDSGSDLVKLAEAEYPPFSDAGIFSICGPVNVPVGKYDLQLNEPYEDYCQSQRTEIIQDLTEIYEKARRLAKKRLNADDAGLPEFNVMGPQLILCKDGKVIFDEHFALPVLKHTSYKSYFESVRPTHYEHDYSGIGYSRSEYVSIGGLPEIYFFDRNSLALAHRFKFYEILILGCVWQIATKLVIAGGFAPQPYYIKESNAYAIRWIPDVRIEAVKKLCAQVGYALQQLSQDKGYRLLTVSSEFKDYPAIDPAQLGVTVLSKFIQSYVFTAAVGKTKRDMPVKKYFPFIQSYFGIFTRCWYFDALFDILKPFGKVTKGLKSMLLLEACEPEDPGFSPAREGHDLPPDTQADENSPVDPLFSVTLAFRDLDAEGGKEYEEDEVPPFFTYEEAMNEDCYVSLRLPANLRLHYLDKVLPGLISSKKPRAQMLLSEMSDKIIAAADSIKAKGFDIIMPRELKHLIRPVTTLSLGLKGPWYESLGFLGLESLLDFDWQVAIGKHKISKKDFEKLLKMAGRIVRFAGHYVYISKEDAVKLQSRLKARPPRASGARLIGVALCGRYGSENVFISQKLKDSIAALLKDQDLEVPKQIKAVLRPYQIRGFRWLARNLLISMGSILADDMGLGKTVQLITALQYLKNKGELSKEKALVVVPTAVIINWAREIAKFAPDLSCNLFYGQKTDLSLIENHDVTVTTYGTLRTHEKELAAITFRTVVLDEAQAIKNTASHVFKAATSLKARAMVAMTGTPVENRLLEYWAIMDFVNAGLLGSQTAFKKEIANPIEKDRDQEKLDLFRAITAPFILRRLKTDKNVIADLPDKTVTDQFCELTPVQAALYESVVEEGLETVSRAADKFNRGNKVLNMILKLRQICNAPEHFSKESSHKGAGSSGKAEALFEILDELEESSRKCLIFTQFKEMGDILTDWIEKKTGKKPQFIHGGVTVKKRTEITDKFQTDPEERCLVLTLKAAGTGLNLTAATAVIHYDLWWNPAVEEQATDRTYRIGQRRDVQVFRLICANTFEEKINELIASKRELSDLTVVTGEQWIGSLDDSELSQIFRLTK